MTMYGPLGKVFWIITEILQLAVVVCAVRAKCFLRFFPLNFYMLAASVLTAARYLVFAEYGLNSTKYFYFYYYSDGLLTICLFFALMGLFSQVFREMGAERFVRVGAIVVLGLTSVVSYFIVRHDFAMVQTTSRGFAAHFVAELSQNLYFVGAVLTYLLWAAVRKLRETRTQLIQFVLALGVYFSALAASYALAVLNLNIPICRIGQVAAGIWLPVAWGYTFLKVPKGAKLETARVASGAQ
jgi:hypothetical protein